MVDALGPPANASSVHGFGQAARFKVEQARGHVAGLVGAKKEEVIFTSGGTEANAMALLRNAPQIITSAIEHVAVLDCAPSAHIIGVDQAGRIDLDALAAAAKNAPEGSIISIMMANNETGVIQPLEQVIKIAHAHGHLVHSDAVQAVGKFAINFHELGLDFMSVSAHKIGGPSGVGALIQREGLASYPRAHGGGQEKNRRPGTENTIGIIGFGAAAAASCSALMDGHDMANLSKWHRNFEAKILAAAPDAVVFGADAPRLANTTNISMPERTSEHLVMAFDLAGIAVSAGSACSSGKVKSSHVLSAMGATKDAAAAIRISSGWDSNEDDFDRLAETWLNLYKQA